ncbi:MAG: hypothetical protein JWO80_4309, partial [Bryobacterales bacterium]|nr:hypothetical protein [Bryobacterales bacterium]
MLTRISAIILFTSAALWGQATTSLRGTIKDTTGAVVSEAVVSLTDESNGSLRKIVSDKRGEYQFLQIAPGKYVVRVEKAGFSTYLNSSVTLEVNTPATLDCSLEVGSVGATVNVEADAASINTVDASLGNTFGERQVKDLPLQTRNVVELLSIQPGVTQTGEVLGARRDQNNITLDGVDANNNQNSGITVALTNGSASSTTGQSNTPGFNAALPIPLDSVEEFRVTVAGQGAEQGRSSGGQVTLVTKSGTNNIHGSLYEYNRNTLLAANDFFNNEAGVPRAPLVRNQFGVSLGGPVIKNRIFFFGNWERRIDASSTPVSRTVPSDSLRQGILKAKLSDGTVYSLNTADILAVDPLHQGFSSAMKQYLNSFPSGNDPSLGLDNGLNFTGLRFNAPQTLDQSAYVAKMDFNIDQARKHTVSVRGTLNGASQDLIAAQYPGQAAAQQLLDNSKGISSNYTWVVKPNMINVATFGLTRLGLNKSGTLGTGLSFTGISSSVNYTSSARPSIQLLPTYNFADNFTWTKGTHTVTTGLNFRFIRNSRNNYTNSFPAYAFSRNTLGGLGGDATTAVTNYINQQLGTTGLSLAQHTAVESGLGDLLGLINQYSALYQFSKDGTTIPFGTPASREYAVNDY